MDISLKSLIILPHLDDEFALVPLIKALSKKNNDNLKIIYCAERTNDKSFNIEKRRIENYKALKTIGVQEKNIIYLNDFFEVKDLELWKSSEDIYNFLKDIFENEKFSQILTLNFEGGHPDHDALALIVKNFANDKNLKKYYVPAYNYRKTFLLPISVFRPLKSQIQYFKIINFNFFCWMDCLKIAYIYKTERKAFLKLLPFIIIQSFFSKKIYLCKDIYPETVEWSKTISSIRYKAKKAEIMGVIKST